MRGRKSEYLTKLEEAFKTTQFVNSRIDSIEITKHPTIEGLYGLSFRQSFNTSLYSDVGYVFLAFYFTSNGVTIPVRAWQPHKFEDGKIIGLTDFLFVGLDKNQ